MITVIGAAETGLNWSDYGVMGCYLLGMVALGLWFSRTSKNTESYLLGGRSMVWWVVGISYLVSLLSTISLVMVPGYAYEHGVTMILPWLFAPFMALAAFYLFIRFYFRGRVFTPFKYLESRFDSRVRIVGSGIYLLTRITYLAIVLYSSAKVFEGAGNWPLVWTILIVGSVGITYTVMGGIRAVIWTDLIQFLILAGGLAVIAFTAISMVPGGVIGTIEYAFEHGRGMPELSQASFYGLNPFVKLTLWIMLIAMFGELLFYNSSDQIAIQRLLSTSSYKQAKRSLWTWIALILPTVAMLWFVGLVMFSFYSHQPLEQRPVKGDLALFKFISTELASPLPGLILAAMLAAVMSTLDSGMNSLATVLTKDFYLRLFRKDASESRQVRFSRWMTLAVGLFAIGVALIISGVSESMKESIMEVAKVWMSFMLVLPAIFLLGVTSRRVTANHALIAGLVGVVVTSGMVAWYLFTKGKGEGKELSFMYVAPPGLIIALIVGYIPSLFCRRRPAENLEDLTLWTLRKD